MVIIIFINVAVCFWPCSFSITKRTSTASSSPVQTMQYYESKEKATVFKLGIWHSHGIKNCCFFWDEKEDDDDDDNVFPGFGLYFSLLLVYAYIFMYGFFVWLCLCVLLANITYTQASKQFFSGRG